MKSNIPNVEYRKVVRDCPFNKGNPRVPLYDYEVYELGGKRAEFRRASSGRYRWTLHDLGGQPIRRPMSIRVYMAFGQLDFDSVYHDASSKEAVPTAEFVAYRVAKEAEHKKFLAEQDRLRCIELRKGEKGVEMYKLLDDIYESVSLPLEYVSRLNSIIDHVKGEQNGNAG